MTKILIVLAALLLGACVGGARNTPPMTVYDFGLPATRLVADGSWSKMALEVMSPSWFDSLNVDYRLAYDDPLKQREYAGSRWVGAPGTLLAQHLRQQLGVSGVTGGAVADCLLRIELQEFSQVFDSPQQSRGVLQGSVSLIDARRQILSERLVSIEKPALTADAQGGVSALVAASSELGRQLADWLARLDSDNTLKRCRSVPGTVAR
jgi:cholesterol transport system auxiliary component